MERPSMKQQDMITIGIKAIGVIALIGFGVWYTIHVWSDCLQENSFLTCGRMLYK